MAYPTVAGHPQYSGNFIPELWSGKLVTNFYDTSVIAAICNTDFEGMIKNHGDTVNIRTTPEITIRPYVKGELLRAEQPDKPKIQLSIDQGEYFFCLEDDIDKIQSDINLLNEWTRDASTRMKLEIDKKVLTSILPEISGDNKGSTAGRISGNINLGSTGSPVALTSSNVLSTIIDMGTVLTEANAPDDMRFLVIPAKMGGLIKQSDLKDASISGDSTSPLRNGRLGMIDTFTIYVSHLLNKTSGTNGEYSIIAGHKMGFTFAMQMLKMETVRMETSFSTGIRGLQVYGYKVVKPEALAQAIVTV